MKTVDERRQRLNEVAKRGIRVPNGAYLSLEHDVPPPPVQEWGWWSHIWDRPSASTKIIQERWDTSERFVSGQKELDAEREAREAEQQRQREAEDAAHRQAETDRLTAELRRTYLATPGVTDADFERDLPEMLRQRAREAVVNDSRRPSMISVRDL